jgi:hypothetical protein
VHRLFAIPNNSAIIDFATMQGHVQVGAVALRGRWQGGGGGEGVGVWVGGGGREGGEGSKTRGKGLGLGGRAEERAYKHHAALLFLPHLLQPFRFSCLSSFVENAVTVTVIEGGGGGLRFWIVFWSLRLGIWGLRIEVWDYCFGVAGFGFCCLLFGV